MVILKLQHTKFAGWQIWRVFFWGVVVWSFKDNGQIFVVGNGYMVWGVNG
jgi:hypothetical protein